MIVIIENLGITLGKDISDIRPRKDPCGNAVAMLTMHDLHLFMYNTELHNVYMNLPSIGICMLCQTTLLIHSEMDLTLQLPENHCKDLDKVAWVSSPSLVHSDSSHSKSDLTRL